MPDYVKPDESFVKDVGALMERLNSFRRAYNNLCAQTAIKNSEQDRLLADIKKLEKRKEHLDGAVKGFADEAIVATKELEARLKRRSDKFENELSDKVTELKTKMAELDVQTSRLDARQSTLDDRERDLAQREDLAASQATDIASQIGNLESRSAELRDREQQLQEFEAGLFRRERLCQKTQDEIGQQRREIQRDREDIAKQLQAAEQLVTDANLRMKQVAERERRAAITEKAQAARSKEFMQIQRGLKKKEIQLNDREQTASSYVMTMGA